MTGARLHWLGADDADALRGAAHLFDGPVEHAEDFLRRGGHHVCLAVVDGTAVGFVVGVEVAHADRAPEMYCDELAVGARHRNRGIATALMDALADRARDRGCAAMWVLTEPDNLAASRTYLRAGAKFEPETCVLYEWQFTS